jgi:hypothetical protein
MNETNDSETIGSPLLDQRSSILFMLFLLLISGITATVVGYRVKSADIDRKEQLLQAYTQLGGSFERANSPNTSIDNEHLSDEQRTFVLAYETNSRARMHGLYSVLDATPPARMEHIIKSLFTIGALEAAHSTEDAWRAYGEPTGSGIKNVNSKAARFARQYDRHLARDTEVKLFVYLSEHREQITHR